MQRCFQLQGGVEPWKFCFLLISNLATIMLRFFRTTGSIFRFLGHFHSNSPDIFNLKSRFSALAPRPICYWDTCGSPVIKCLYFFVVYFFSSAAKWKNCAIVPSGHWALNTMTTNCDPMRCSHADHACYLDDD